MKVCHPNNHKNFKQFQCTVDHACLYYVLCLCCFSFSVSTTNSATGGGCTSPTIHPPVFSSMSNKDSKPSAPPATESNSTTVLPSDGQKARVLYDYDAADMTELSLLADEVIVCFILLF